MSTTDELTKHIDHCSTCGDPIGPGQKKNVQYYCDREEGTWCGSCFDNTPCGKGEHGEGCAVMAVSSGEGDIP